MAMLFLHQKNGEKRLGMAEAKIIYCPRCGRKVATYDGRSTINVIANCKKCRKRVVYYVDTKKAEIKPIPPRNCSSGKTFH